MPTPLELVLDPLSLTIIALYFGLMAWERLFPRQRFVAVRGWYLKGIAAFATYFLLSSYLPLVWDGYLSAFQLFDLTGLGTLAGTLVGLLVYEVGVYLWHRSMHKSDALWLGFHQMHHSAERVDVAGSFWFSLTDMIGWTMLGSLALVVVVGLSPAAATNVILITAFLAIFQHANIRTPVWLGYLIQRPEMHAIHHQRGVHHYNFCDLAFIDWLGGTFRNPKAERLVVEGGFYDGSSAKVGAMLLGCDINKEAQPGAQLIEHAA
ncbi:sterol desaturase family protein [Halioxenophilus sp. WMMB6]|uniref:sterol desaturase family protein n=1 Tax=Halioxenophilus sp. WMMB6 TaxID=3073815 RepID=UPI00295E482E|nr:sterol desaturase family protein [Halioxenophilus sp. WMMB6]